MAECPNCQKSLEDEVKVCDSCGTEIAAVQQEPVAPVEVMEAPAEVVEAPAVVEEQALQVGKFRLPAKKTLIAFGAAVVAVIVLVALVLSLFGGNDNKINYATYIKDGDLYVSNAGKKPWEVTEDAGSSSVLFSKDGKIMFYTDEDGDFYARYTSSAKKDPIKIASNISSQSVSEDGKKVAYIKNDNLYLHNLKEEKKIATKVENVILSRDGKRMYYLTDDGDLYLSINGKDGKKVGTGLSDLTYVSEDFKTIYYTKEDSLYRSKGSKEAERILTDVERVITVYEDGSLYFYQTAEEDDGEDRTGRTLCYYNGKKETVLSENASVATYSNEKPLLIYRERVKLDEEGVKYDYFVAAKAKTAKWAVDDVDDLSINKNGSEVYYITNSDDEGHGDLYKAAISGANVKAGKKLDTGVYTVMVYDGGYLYYKNYKSNENGSVADLFINGKSVMTDVLYSGIRYHKDSKRFVFKDEDGVLYMWKSGKPVKVHEDIKTFTFTGDGDLFYLADYENNNGDLYFFNGRKSKLVDTDVSALSTILYNYWD